MEEVGSCRCIIDIIPNLLQIQDLQRQVRTRLGLDYLPINTGCVQSSVDTGLVYRPRLVTQHYHADSSVMKVITKPDSRVAEPHPDSQVAVIDDKELGHDKKTKLEVNRWCIAHRSLECVKPSEPIVDHPVIEPHPRRREHQQTVSEYVNSKYGVPMEQLLHLTSTGSFQTHIIDSTGDGSGPFINVPLEANILFPTPQHVTTASHFTSSHTPNIGDNTRVQPHSSIQNSTNVPKDTPRSKPGARQVVYNGSSSDRVCPSNGLQFEARFEGGNLQQAVQM